ncbi:MAG: Glycine-rich RNA-binding protein 8 [Candidatus Woesebacteria bacterium GW2011_GWB1_43_14]|uniref:Glycine-rich RNA-binding protein 8 n=1 Tax=Candidatus Woesebacteria bacterium GW2011_GWB1_43_14 TaxID=1618578 RepID=A0A0G1DM19_9BACT|nr:MAG: Glycine-rich RNA-binding protein 8 [Candidatus Woesebacteria bacterium GW2011_GWA1_39_11b]KKS98930.1 MAG: Glycine-rich RNA-binding protein 8 [Candidatus Woesebacteria bacterium GW2011_GWB1_43_14]
MKKIYVGNLPYTIDNDQLRKYFAQAGTVVDAVVISDKYSGRSKGFGFVEFETEEESKKAVEMFNGKDFEGRNLVVNEARPREDSGESSGARSGSTSEPQE